MVQDIRLTTKNCVCTTSKSNNQIQTCTDALMKHMGGGEGKKAVFFPQKRSYELGMDVKQGKRVGFSGQ